MYVKNVSRSTVSAKIGDKSKTIAHGQCVYIAPSEENDPVLATMIARHTVEVVDDAEGRGDVEGRAAAAMAEAEERKMQVVDPLRNQRNTTVLQRCAYSEKNGKRCSAQVAVPMSEYDVNKPAFCPHHRAANPADYERVNGQWHRKGGVF